MIGISWYCYFKSTPLQLFCPLNTESVHIVPGGCTFFQTSIQSETCRPKIIFSGLRFYDQITEIVFFPFPRLIPPRISICVFSRAEAACAAEQCCRHNIQPVLISFFITFTPLPFEYDICLFFLLLLIPVMLNHWTDVLTQFLTE